MGNTHPNTVIRRKLNKIDVLSIKRYIEFWGYNKIEFFAKDEISIRLNELYNEIKADFTGKKALIVSDAYRENDGCNEYITPSQLVYDLDVFVTIPGEIHKRITINNFSCFVKKAFAFLETQGFKIYFSCKGLAYNLLANDHYDLISSAHVKDYDKIILINCGNEKVVNEFYDKYKSVARIERHRLLELLREWLIEEICAYFKSVLSQRGVSLYLLNWNWAHNNYLYPKKDITSQDREERAKYSIYNIAGDEQNHERFLKEFYSDDYSIDYVKNVMDIPLRHDYGIGCIHHSDMASEYLNVSGAERITSDTLENPNNTIYLLGGCVFFGYAIDDKNTIASYLQRKLNKENPDKKLNVANYATWGGNIDQTYMTFYELEYKPGDIVAVSYAGLIPVGDDIYGNDVSVNLSNAKADHDFYYDGVVHCNKEGYNLVADRLYNIIKPSLESNAYDKKAFKLEREEQYKTKDTMYSEVLEEYLASVKEDLPPLYEKDKVYGSAVMNCNPFTLGHRYLIESAAAKVDYLIIFVVEEDKSRFPFNDRIELVKKGTTDLSNVYVIPSGKLMISAVTFPGYFLKDNPSEDNADSSMDVEIFGRYIASALGITKRFVGQEPTDFVTRRYNETMAKILPRFGVEVNIIERLKSSSDEAKRIISASTVRKLLDSKQYDELKNFVPKTTYDYLMNNFVD